MEAISAFGDVLRTARVRAGISLKQLAHHLGLSVPYVSDIERNRLGVLSRNRIIETAKLLSIRPFQLLTSAVETAGFLIPNFATTRGREVFGMLLFGAAELTEEHWERIAVVVADPANKRWTVVVREGVVAMPRGRKSSRSHETASPATKRPPGRVMEVKDDSGPPKRSVASHGVDRIDRRKVSAG